MIGHKDTTGLARDELKHFFWTENGQFLIDMIYNRYLLFHHLGDTFIQKDLKCQLSAFFRGLTITNLVVVWLELVTIWLPAQFFTN